MINKMKLDMIKSMMKTQLILNGFQVPEISSEQLKDLESYLAGMHKDLDSATLLELTHAIIGWADDFARNNI